MSNGAGKHQHPTEKKESKYIRKLNRTERGERRAAKVTTTACKFHKMKTQVNRSFDQVENYKPVTLVTNTM